MTLICGENRIGTDTMKPGKTLLNDCLKHLNVLPNIQASIDTKALTIAGVNADGILTIHSHQQSVQYIYKTQPFVTSTIAELAISYCKYLEEKTGQKVILFVRYLANAVIDRFLQHNIEFIDTAGNIYLHSPAIYILIRGQRPPTTKISSSNITATTLKIIYSFLQSPHILQSNYQEIAKVSGVAPSTVSRTIQDLYELGYLQRQRDGNYRIINYMKLLERWEMGYAESLRAKLILGIFTPGGGRSFAETTENIIQIAKESNFLIGGELGAAIATSYLRPQSATLHLPNDDSKTLGILKLKIIGIAAKMKLKPSPEGEIILIQQFGINNGWTNYLKNPDRNTNIDFYGEILTDPLLIHAELLLTADERLRETADRIYHQYIEPRGNIFGEKKILKGRRH